jgi:iron(III) transport system ATP-binding protein
MSLRLLGIAVAHGARAILQDVSLEVPVGGTAVVSGASGSGKTTLLRALAGLEAIDRGEIRWCEALWSSASVTVAPRARNLGMVFQDLALWPHINVLENVTITLARGAVSRQRAEYVLDSLGVLSHAKRYPAELSGGEQQRVAVARALARGPEVLLLDEPTNQLDADTRERALALLAREQRERTITILVTTHEPQHFVEHFPQVLMGVLRERTWHPS